MKEYFKEVKHKKNCKKKDIEKAAKGLAYLGVAVVGTAVGLSILGDL